MNLKGLPAVLREPLIMQTWCCKRALGTRGPMAICRNPTNVGCIAQLLHFDGRF